MNSPAFSQQKSPIDRSSQPAGGISRIISPVSSALGARRGGGADARVPAFCSGRWLGNLGWMVDGWDGCCSADAHGNRQGNSNSSSSPFFFEFFFKKFFFIINQFHIHHWTRFFLFCGAAGRCAFLVGARARDRPIDRLWIRIPFRVFARARARVVEFPSAGH